MRKIEERIIEAIDNKRQFIVNKRRWENGRLGATWLHDAVFIQEKYAEVWLCNNQIARIFPEFVWASSCGWRTATTKSRLNAILRRYCDIGLYQHKGEWYLQGYADAIFTGKKNPVFIDGMSIPRVR